MKYFVYTVIVIVAATIVAGFFIVGSPQDALSRRFDDQRISNLQFIQSEIVSFWINKDRLPNDLAELEDDIRGVQIPVDPQTGKSYDYDIYGQESFGLCATFDLESIGIENPPRIPVNEKFPVAQNWEHKTGYTCFERTIDPDLYKETKPF